jgi:hypothetical protein
MRFTIRDVSDWEESGDISTGTREKDWLIRPDNRRRALIKYPLKSPGELWAEKLASEFGKVYGCNVPEADLARRENKNGVLAYSFLSRNESLVEGAALFIEVDSNFDPHIMNGYDVQLIQTLLPDAKLFEDFLRIMLFDALIGNQDRHVENWGIIEVLGGNKYLSPAYDNSSSLGWQLSEQYVSEVMHDPARLTAFIKGGKSMVRWHNRKIKHLEMIDLLLKEHTEIIKREIEKLELLTDDTINSLTYAVPESFMGDILKQFVVRITTERKNILLSKVV